MELSLTSPPLVVVVVVVFFTFLLQVPRYLRRREPGKQPRAHDLKVYPLLGTLPHLVRNRHRFLEWSTGVLQRSPTYTFSFEAVGFGGGVITANPANVEHFLKTNFSNYPKGEATVSMVEDLLGGGIFNSDGDRWLWQRKAASHEFSTSSLRAFVGDTVRSEAAQRLLPLLARAARDGRVLDVQDVLQRFAFDNICNVAFGEDPACLSDADAEGEGGAAAAEFMRAFDDAQSAVMARLMSRPRSLWRLRRLLNTESERRMRAAADKIRAYAARIVRDRRARVEAGRARGDDLLSRFAAGGEHGDESLRDVVTNFILAGRDTTSSALTWFFWLVSGRPDVEDRIVREIRAARASAAAASAGAAGTTTTVAPFSLDELRGMHYLHAAVTESMRLYPPVAINTRRCECGEFLPDGTFVGAGWQVSYSAYAMARVAAVWGGDCEVFSPERWFDGDGGVFRPASPFKYPVFHAGPRTCLGREMAYVQMKSIAACVLERFTLRFAGNGPPAIELAVTLRMKGGLPMQVKERMAQVNLQLANAVR